MGQLEAGSLGRAGTGEEAVISTGRAWAAVGNIPCNKEKYS